MLNQSCQQCGSANAEQARFCARCGAPLDQDQTVVQSRFAPPDDAAPKPETAQRAPHLWLDDKTDATQEALQQSDQGGAPGASSALPTQASAPPSSAQAKQCPFCAETIRMEAIKCRHCGEIVDPTRRHASAPAVYQNGHVSTPVYQQQVWNPAVAGLLSFLIPGAGQLYKGSVGTGIVWFFAVLIGYAFLIVSGLILHIICICTAASGDTSRRGG